MTDAEYVTLLQWATPRLGLRWAGYRDVRGQVCKRIRRRIGQLGLGDAAAYRARLEAQPEEWAVLEGLCVVTISRFYRDRGVWDTLRQAVLPAVADAAIAAGDEELRVWSLGCASGEEPYTLSIAWVLDLAHRYPGLRLRILATDVDEHVLRRARVAEYAAGSLRELPAGWVDQAFEPHGERFLLRPHVRASTETRRMDVRRELPNETFRVILCRNVAFTYFAEPLQQETLARICTRLSDGGALVLGRHEQPPATTLLEPWIPKLGLHRHVPHRPSRR
jgi:chemotaxis protein methyltransferase CheR